MSWMEKGAVVSNSGRLGVHAANVAPEFGVAESAALLQVLQDNGLQRQAEQFVELAYRSRKWEKWMLKPTQADQRERALIAGHYVFATPECREIKTVAARELSCKGIGLDVHLKGAVKRSIKRYLTNFRLVS